MKLYQLKKKINVDKKWDEPIRKYLALSVEG